MPAKKRIASSSDQNEVKNCLQLWNNKLEVILFGNTSTGKIKVMNALLEEKILPETRNVCCMEGAGSRGKN